MTRWREKLPRWSMRVAQGVLILPLLAAVPFVATQLRLGLHPQLEAEYGRTSYSDYYGRNTMAAGMVPQQADNAPMYDQNVALTRADALGGNTRRRRGTNGIRDE